MNRESTRAALQVIYVYFRERGGQWPTFGYFERWWSRYREEEAIQVISRIPGELLKPLPFLNGRPDPGGRLVLTAAGMARCLGSDDDAQNLIDAIRCLVRHDTTYDLPEDPVASGVPISSEQLAEELNLPRLTDPNSLKRLVVLLEGEGLVMSDEYS